MPHTTEIVTTPSRAVAVIRFHVRSAELPMIGERMGQAFGTVVAELRKDAITPSGPAIASYERAGDGFEVAAGFPVPATFTPASGLTVKKAHDLLLALTLLEIFLELQARGWSANAYEEWLAGALRSALLGRL